MNNMPPKLRVELDADPYYHRCARESWECSGRITWEHCWIYASNQIQERWAIIPLCWYHHLGEGLNKEWNQFLSLKRATLDDLAKYPKAPWGQRIKYFMQKYHWQGYPQ